MKGWPTKPFGDVLDIRSGRNQREVESDDGEYPILGSAGKIMGYASEYICDAGTTIIGRKGTINSPIFSETRFWNVDTAFGLSPKGGLDGKYLYYFCRSYDFDQHNRGTTIPSLVKSDLIGIEIPLPPLEEQRRIVAVLDEAFAAIATATANAEKNLANARELLIGHLNNQLSGRQSEPWVRVPLGDIGEVLDRFRKPVTKSDRRPGEYPYYGATGIVDWIDDYIFDEPLVLLGEDGAKWGPGERSAFSASGKYWVNNHAHIMRPNRKVVSDDWLIYYLNMTDLMPYVTGVTVPKLNQERMRSIPISLPPLEQQHKLVAKMDALSNEVVELTALKNSKLARLTALKQSLLHRAFTGELTAAMPETIAA